MASSPGSAPWFDPRPHWGKLFAMAPADVQKHRARLEDFRELARSFDSGGKFRNRFLDTCVRG